ncbi:TetR family transcriptional regulator [Nocardia pseudovaccinii]|uniref:TetR family transcriptional regulator n=1 Tax=Nocardia pseudovaccinii TaxID=189540 RepID=UPI0007A4548B|nr:TetR family transcriptional regulator [Nocardia pseudovaccinii]
MADDSRARILQIALDLFAERGYHTVSVREIAEQVGLTKTAVLYHFPSKSDIVAALVEPLLVDSEAVLETAARGRDAQARRWAVVAGLLEVWLSHGQLLRMQMQDQALSADEATFARLRTIALSAQDLIAGPRADFTTRVRAAQVYAALSDPVVIFADRAADELREAILDGARRLLGTAADPQPSAARSDPVPLPTAEVPATRPNRRGRPGAMTSEMIESARHMRDSGRPIDEIAAEFDISRATLYRNLSKHTSEL